METNKQRLDSRTTVELSVSHHTQYQSLSKFESESSIGIIRKDGTLDMNSKDQIKNLFSRTQYQKMLIYISLNALPMAIVAVFITSYGGTFFSDCTEEELLNPNIMCSDFETYLFYNTLTSSITGGIAFCFSGFIGRLSDSFGRKPFLILICVIGLVNRGSMIFMEYFLFDYILYIYFILSTLNGFNEGFPVINAYYSDILPTHLKTIGFGISSGIAGIQVLFGAIIGTLVTIYLGISANWVIVLIIYILLIIYTITFIDESLPLSSRANFDSSNCNPFKLLLLVRNNPFVFWIAIIQFTISLPVTGIFSIAGAFILGQLKLSSESEEVAVTAGFLISVGVGGIITSMFILPCLKTNKSDLNIAEIGIVGSILCQIVFIIFAYFPSVYLVILAGLLVFSAAMMNAALNSILTNYVNKREQGQAFGILQSYVSLSSVVVPFAFGYGYIGASNIGFPALPFIVGVFVMMLALVFTRIPLKGLIQRQSRKKKKTIDIDCSTTAVLGIIEPSQISVL